MHPLTQALQAAAAQSKRAAEIEHQLYAPGNPSVRALTEAEAAEANRAIDSILRSLLSIEGVADRLGEIAGGAA